MKQKGRRRTQAKEIGYMCGSSSVGFIFLLTQPNGPGESSYTVCFSNNWFGTSSSYTTM